MDCALGPLETSALGGNTPTTPDGKGISHHKISRSKPFSSLAV